jgi:hypothetical protein
MQGIREVGGPINSIINELVLPDPLKKPWLSIYGGALAGSPETVKRIDAWKTAVLEYYERQRVPARRSTNRAKIL